jgi:hypothetical protein
MLYDDFLFPISIFITCKELTLRVIPMANENVYYYLFLDIKYIQYKTIKEQLPNQSPRA